MKKKILAIVVIILLLVGALYWFKNDKAYINYFYKNYKRLPKTLTFKFMDYITNDCSINSRRRNPIPSDDNEALALSSIEFAKEGQTYIYTPTKKEINALSKVIIK